ncbi:MAG: glycosyltransferase family A protein [Marinicellaceae bacterium]
MEFEFNFGQQTLSTGVKKNNKVYASVDGIALPLSNEELVFMNKETGENHVMTHQVLNAISLCQEFKPLDQHITNINRSMPELSSDIGAIEKVTQFMIKNKLFIEENVWKKNLSQDIQQSSILSSGIVIRTCNRPDQLSRLLSSLVKYQKKHNTNFKVQIYDDSTTEKSEKLLENICKEFKSQLSIDFYGSTWQSQFIQMLKTEFTEHHHIIDWLLKSKENVFTGGRVWNFATLNNAGKKFLFFDDDYIFEPRIIDKKSRLVELNDRPDLSVGFSLSLSDIRESSVAYEEDVLTEMLNSCGQTIGNWLSTNDVEISSLQDINLYDIQRINSHSLIKSVGNGTWGSPRANSNFWLYYLKGKEKEEFWHSREVYLENIEASNLMHYTQNYELLSITKFSPSAIDNSTLCSFTIPVNRVEDHFFNAVSLFCYPDQVSLHFPFMMGHIQASTRDRSSTNHIAMKPNFNKFVADYALTLIDTTDAKDPVLRMKTLSNYLYGLADASESKIHNRLKEYLTQIRSDLVMSMQFQLKESPNAPVYWQADVRELIETNGKAVLQNRAAVLDGWDDKLSIEECVDRARIELNEVAEAMEIWPDIWEFCQINK